MTEAPAYVVDGTEKALLLPVVQLKRYHVTKIINKSGQSSIYRILVPQPLICL